MIIKNGQSPVSFRTKTSLALQHPIPPHPMCATILRNERNTFTRTVRELCNHKVWLTSEGLLTHACLGWYCDNCQTWNVRVSVPYVLVHDYTVNTNPPDKAMVSAFCSFPVGATTNYD